MFSQFNTKTMKGLRYFKVKDYDMGLELKSDNDIPKDIFEDWVLMSTVGSSKSIWRVKSKSGVFYTYCFRMITIWRTWKYADVRYLHLVFKNDEMVAKSLMDGF